MNYRAEILTFDEGEKKGSFFLTLMGQIRYDFKVLYTETRIFEIDLTVLQLTYGEKNSFIKHSTVTLQEYFELLIEQKFKALEPHLKSPPIKKRRTR